MSGSPLTGRTVVVTGAARGLGAAIAGKTARRGARVALLGHEKSRLESLAATLPGPALARDVDVTDPEALAAAATAVRARLGPPSAVVANAGVAEGGPLPRPGGPLPPAGSARRPRPRPSRRSRRSSAGPRRSPRARRPGGSNRPCRARRHRLPQRDRHRHDPQHRPVRRAAGPGVPRRHGRRARGRRPGTEAYGRLRTGLAAPDPTGARGTAVGRPARLTPRTAPPGGRTTRRVHGPPRCGRPGGPGTAGRSVRDGAWCTGAP